MTENTLSLPAPPSPLTAGELKQKLALCRAALSSHNKKGILLVQEGALRWLTGCRNQIADIRPGDVGPVQALVVPRESGWDITFITTPYEMPRVKDQFPEVYDGIEGIGISFSVDTPRLEDGIARPDETGYPDIAGGIVRPLAGGLEGNQYARLQWLAAAATALLAKTAHELEPGMNGSRVKGLLYKNFYDAGVESNLFLVALPGQERHPHPLYHERYRVEKKGWMKLVAGARYADMIYSASVMIKMGDPTEDELRWHRALQDAVVEYADCYRNGAVEGKIFEMIGGRFERIGKACGLEGFAESAYLHHPGGPTSPLGNRDYLIQPGGTRTMFPWMQFAINPVESRYGTKVEIQGIVTPDGPPRFPDVFAFVPEKLLTHRLCRADGGTECAVADIIAR
ncbi:MAG TPA: M24 family metallopeptidase [Spirochaetes bacterium]|nr:M24 family metallopeptidase [Spirochaetota bacterium]